MGGKGAESTKLCEQQLLMTPELESQEATGFNWSSFGNSSL